MFNSVSVEMDTEFDGVLNLYAFHSDGNTLTVGDGSYWEVVCPSGTISIYNTTLSGSHASGGATFKSLLSDGNIDDGDNEGWIFYYTGCDEFRFGIVARWTTNFTPPPYQYKLL